MESNRIKSYREFWPYYLSEHRIPACRAWHYLGTSLALGALTAAIVAMQPWFLLLAILGGYAPAWIGHFFIEKNRPATFQYPFWSLFSDFRMYALWLSGRLPAELNRNDIPR